MYKHFFKRIIDFVCAFLALTVFSPLFLVLMIIGFFAMKGNPFFTQERPGYHEAAKTVMEELTGCRNASEFQTLGKEKRDEAFRHMIGKGIMINQAARLTGWTRTVIRRALGG